VQQWHTWTLSPRFGNKACKYSVLVVIWTFVCLLLRGHFVVIVSLLPAISALSACVILVETMSLREYN